MAEIWLPFKRGNFIETRSGLINVSPCGRSATQAERNQFEAYDKVSSTTQNSFHQHFYQINFFSINNRFIR
jgi:hypothetical protein